MNVVQNQNQVRKYVNKKIFVDKQISNCTLFEKYGQKFTVSLYSKRCSFSPISAILGYYPPLESGIYEDSREAHYEFLVQKLTE